jgi:hypothetical protein
METVIKFKEQLSTSQLKMAIDVLKAIGLNVIEDKNVIELNNEQKDILETRLKNIKDGNFKSKDEAHEMFEKCLK